MDKQGKGSIWIPVAVFLVVGLLGVIAYGVLFMEPVAQTTFADQQTGSNGNGVYISTGATTLSIAGKDALQEGTSVGSTSYIDVSGVGFKTGITSASPKQVLDILLVNNTGYHNVYIPGQAVPASPTMPIEAKFFANSSLTINAWNQNDQLMTSAGGTQNETGASGATYTWKLKFTAQDKKSTQDMRCVLESTAGQNTTDVILSGSDLGASFLGKNKPNWYSMAGSNSGVYVYDVKAISGADPVYGTLTTKSGTSKTLAGGNYVKIACYTKEWFLDSYTGKVVFDVEDSQGNLQSIAAYSFTGYIN